MGKSRIMITCIIKTEPKVLFFYWEYTDFITVYWLKTFSGIIVRIVDMCKKVKVENMQISKRKVLIGYIIAGLTWIFGTDYILNLLDNDIHKLLIISKVKGTIFVILTSFYIFSLLRKKEKLESVKEEKEKLLTLINSMEDFVNFKDGEGKWIEVNEFGLKLFQLEHVNYKGLTDIELAKYTDFYKETLYSCAASDERTWKEGKPTRCEQKVPTTDGTIKTFDTIKVPTFHKDGTRKALVVMGRDISERIKTEGKLEKSEQRYKSLFEYNPELVYMLNTEGEITNINPQFKKLLGVKKEKYIGHKITALVAKKDRDRMKEGFERIIQEKTAWNDQEIVVEVEPYRKIIFECTAVPMIINEEVVGIIGYAKDITNIKEAEERLRKTEKLSVVGELAASVAHEIRNPLTSLKGFTQMLQSEDDKHKMYYKIMFDELERINQIVGELLVLAKPQSTNFAQCDVGKMMKEVISLLDSQANLYGAKLISNFKEESCLIECEGNMLKQLFINVIKNSIEASAKTISVTIAEKGEDNVLIRIEDDGNGIEKERLKRLGEPFYSVKEKGTGLGLTVSYRIVETHKGNIDIYSSVNIGTTVDIVLPKTMAILEGEDKK